jgi:hypothetical protein
MVLEVIFFSHQYPGARAERSRTIIARKLGILHEYSTLHFLLMGSENKEGTLSYTQNHRYNQKSDLEETKKKLNFQIIKSYQNSPSYFPNLPISSLMTPQ